jgi:hypothetical protein
MQIEQEVSDTLEERIDVVAKRKDGEEVSPNLHAVGQMTKTNQRRTTQRPAIAGKKYNHNSGGARWPLRKERAATETDDFDPELNEEEKEEFGHRLCACPVREIISPL